MVKDITFHYTNEQMAKDLINLLPLKENQIVIDAGSGKNKVFYNNLPCFVKKYEYEIEDGNDFLLVNQKADWIIGNPPYHISWKFTEKALELSNFGIAWLVNNQALNSHFTPRRIKLMQDNNFYLQKIHVVADNRWFGRYYFLIFSKESNNFVSCNLNTYKTINPSLTPTNTKSL
jgi:hypothetical protein